MRRLIMGMTLTCAAVSLANAQEDDSIYGTYNVRFQPVQIQGELQSCSLIYNAVQPDFAYLNGRVIAVNGNISFASSNGMPVLIMKIGVMEVLGNKKMVRPNFAYLQTANHSSAKVQQKTTESGSGHRLFVYPLTDSLTMDLFDEMVNTKKVTLAFNRVKNGVDVLVPIEFDVYETRVDGARAERTRSKKTMNDFANCIALLTESSLANK